ncbi:MAG TPA: histone H1 [Paludibacter sp.]
MINHKNSLLQTVLLPILQKNAGLQFGNSNKTAGARARKASLEIEKVMKEFRKVSIEISKK